MKTHLILVLVASLQGILCQGLRDSELTTAVQELTLVLRGLRSDITSNFDKLLSDLHQDRLARAEQTMSLRDKVEENRLGLEILKGQVAALTTGQGCSTTLDILPTGGTTRGKNPEAGTSGASGGVISGEGASAGVGSAGASGRVVAKSPLQRGLDKHFHQEKKDEDDGSESTEQVTTLRECPAPFQRAGKHCLTMLRERTSWSDARSRCHTYAQLHVSHITGSAKVNGDLVIPHDMEGFINYIKNNDFPGKAWVGASTDGWGGMWTWIDGSLIKELPWLYTQPGLTGSLLAVDEDANFHTALRRHVMYPICELIF